MYKKMSGMYKKMSDNHDLAKAFGKPKKNTPEKLNFLTPKVMTVLEFFLATPLKEYYEREVARKTGVSRGSAHKILILLADVAFLSREERGRMLIYKLNLAEPTIRQLKIAVNAFALKKLVDKLKQNSRKVVLFGSCSQGADTEDSDIDMLIITAEKEDVRKILSEFNRKSERKVAPITVDMSEFVRLKKEDKPLYENIERGITLWEAE
jgi:predicted nucleotidyltransferase